MKNKKNIKREIKSKNKYLGLAVILVLVAFALVGFNRILGQSAGIITSVCKTNGGILMDKANCPGDADRYDLVASGNGSGGIIGSGQAAFTNDGGVLDKEGRVWSFDFTSQQMVEKTQWRLPADIAVTDIIQWNTNFFITRNGDLYHRITTLPVSWELIQMPTPTPTL